MKYKICRKSSKSKLIWNRPLKIPTRIIEDGIPEETAQPVLLQYMTAGGYTRFIVGFYEDGNWCCDDSGHVITHEIIGWATIIQEELNKK